MGTLISPVSRSMSESSGIGVGSKVTAEGVLLVSKEVTASIVSFDKCWKVPGMEPSEEKLTASPGLGLAVLMRCE